MKNDDRGRPMSNKHKKPLKSFICVSDSFLFLISFIFAWYEFSF